MVPDHGFVRVGTMQVQAIMPSESKIPRARNSLRWAKTRVLKTDTRVEPRVLKTLACQNGFQTLFKQW